MNSVTISFAQGGFVLTTVIDNQLKTEVFVSQGKLNKAVRAAVEELSLLPKKADDEVVE